MCDVSLIRRAGVRRRTPRRAARSSPVAEREPDLHQRTRLAPMARYTTPVRRMCRSDAGTSDTPMPAATRLTIVGIWIASCSIRGVKPASRQKPTMRSYSPTPALRGKRMNGSSASVGKGNAARPAPARGQCRDQAARAAAACTRRPTSTSGGTTRPTSSSSSRSSAACASDVASCRRERERRVGGDGIRAARAAARCRRRC